MAVIKQNDARMEDLRESMQNLLADLEKEYPDISFDITRDQTLLLTYTIDNLKSNLGMGALMACLILLLFMRRWRLSLLVVLSIPLSLVVTILSFYLLGISLNVISLSGLILGVGKHDKFAALTSWWITSPAPLPCTAARESSPTCGRQWPAAHVRCSLPCCHQCSPPVRYSCL